MPWGILVRTSGEGKSEEFVVGHDVEMTSLPKVLTAKYIVSNSRSKVLYLVSADFSALEKKAIGHHSPLTSCCKTAPTVTSEASAITHVGASGKGWTRRDPLASACLMSEKAVRAVSDHASMSD